MSRILSIFVLALFWTTGPVLGQYPIPSFEVSIHGKATFSEQKSNNCDSPLAKRTLHVHVSCVSSLLENCSATVWVYSLDGHDTYGPYTVNGGETIAVEIDEREWGAYVESDYAITVDVWIDRGDFLILRR